MVLSGDYCAPDDPFITICLRLIEDVCGPNSTLQTELLSVIDEINKSDLGQVVDPGQASPVRDLSHIFCDYIVRTGLLSDLIAMHHHYDSRSVWDAQTCVVAASSGRLQQLQYMVENGCRCDAESGAAAAALAGHLPVLQYVHSQFTTTAWSPTVASNSAYNGHMHCLTFIHTQGHAWNELARVAAGERPAR